MDDFLRALENSIDGIPAGSLKPETVLETLSQWDSLARLTTLALLQSEYSRDVSGSAIQACTTIADLFDLTR